MKELKEDLENNKNAKSDKTLFCVKHISEELLFYCQTCDIPICKDCSVIEHKDHKYNFAKVKNFVTSNNQLILYIRNYLMKVKKYYLNY